MAAIPTIGFASTGGWGRTLTASAAAAKGAFIQELQRGRPRRERTITRAVEPAMSLLDRFHHFHVIARGLFVAGDYKSVSCSTRDILTLSGSHELEALRSLRRT